MIDPGCTPRGLRLVISDLDHTFLGEELALATLVRSLYAQRERLWLGIATGRTLQACLSELNEKRPIPGGSVGALVRVIIAATGTEVYWLEHGQLRRDVDHEARLMQGWGREGLARALSGVDGLIPQPAACQTTLRLAYEIKPTFDPAQVLAATRRALSRAELAHRILVSQQRWVDVVPGPADKGAAVDHVARVLKIEPSAVAVCGDSGNDAAFFDGHRRGVIVANHTDELAYLRGHRLVYFARHAHAAGVLEGLLHHGFLTVARTSIGALS